MSVFHPEALAALPALSRAKILHMEDKRRAAFMAAREAEDRLNDGKERIGQRLGALVAEQRDALRNAPDSQAAQDAIRASFSRQIELSNEEFAHLENAHKRAVSALNEFAYLEKAHDWTNLVRRSGAKLQLQICQARKPRSGDYRAEVQKVREQIAQVSGEISQVENAPTDKSTFRADVIAEIEAIAERGALHLNFSARHGAPLGLSNHISLTLAGSDLIGDGGRAFFVWLCKDLLISRVEAMIDAADFSRAMTLDEQERSMLRLMEQRLELERQEEALISAAADVEQFIPRRSDADPRAVLMVRDV